MDRTDIQVNTNVDTGRVLARAALGGFSRSPAHEIVMAGTLAARKSVRAVRWHPRPPALMAAAAGEPLGERHVSTAERAWSRAQRGERGRAPERTRATPGPVKRCRERTASQDAQP